MWFINYMKSLFLCVTLGGSIASIKKRLNTLFSYSALKDTTKIRVNYLTFIYFIKFVRIISVTLKC